MSNTPSIAARLHELARDYNRELALEASLKALLGLVFSFFTFGLVYWIAWFAGFFFAGSFGLEAWQFAVLATGLFLVVATWSAWWRVDPLAGLQPLTDQQLMLTWISQASPHLLYFSPRHATAGAALVLIGGPANVFEAFGVWGYRLRLDSSLIDEAARLLEQCAGSCPIEDVRAPSAAVLLKRLSLIKIVPREESQALTLTQKGSDVLSRAKARAGKRSKASGGSRGKRE